MLLVSGPGTGPVRGIGRALRPANKKPPGRRHRRLRASAMWRSPSG